MKESQFTRHRAKHDESLVITGLQRIAMEPELKKAFISLRIGFPQWMPENRTLGLLGLSENVLKRGSVQ